MQDIFQKVDPDGVLKGIAYDKTLNTPLGLPGTLTDFLVGNPYNTWPASVRGIGEKVRSTLTRAFEDVLKDSKVPVGNEGKIVIDIAHLEGL
jgi:hypothetical protein